MLQYEERLWRKGLRYVAGVDEVGRGPLAGPVVAAVVILPRGANLRGVKDSKCLSPEMREELLGKILEEAQDFSIGRVEHLLIDRINILQASFLAMKRALQGLTILPDHVLVDGHAIPDLPYPQSAIIRGDQTSLSIAAASILAKVYRDRWMEGYDLKFPQYSFFRNKGYPTSEHLEALERYGPCEIHRRSFRPVLNCSKVEI